MRSHAQHGRIFPLHCVSGPCIRGPHAATHTPTHPHARPRSHTLAHRCFRGAAHLTAWGPVTPSHAPQRERTCHHAPHWARTICPHLRPRTCAAVVLVLLPGGATGLRSLQAGVCAQGPIWMPTWAPDSQPSASPALWRPPVAVSCTCPACVLHQNQRR